MGSYKEIKGDLLAMAKEGKFDVIAHGCNCFKTMGAGIAYSVARQFPTAYQADKVDRRLPLQRLGDFTVYYTSEGLIIFNLYSQYQGGPNLNYTALELSLIKMSMTIPLGKKKIGLPLIGCGIAGGDWEKVKSIIQRVLSDFDVTIVIYDK